MLKKCNKCGFQQNEFLKVDGVNRCKGCNAVIDNKDGKMLSDVTVSAYDKRVVQEIFWMTMEVFEKYIEKANYYPSDWQNRKKINDGKVTREFSSVEEAESVLSTNLFGLKTTVKNKAPFIIEEIKDEYYKWVNATEINVDNCPERLRHWLFEINEILEGRGERFAKEVAEEAHEHVRKMSNEEYERKMNQAFGAYNAPLNREREIEQSLRGQTYKSVETKKRFGGDNEKERGEKTFNRIASEVADKHGKFDYYQKQIPQQRSNSEIIRDVKNNPQNWRLDEVITEYNVLGGAKRKEIALIHSSAQVSYDGAVSDDRQPVYLAQRFNQEEIRQINEAKRISQSSNSKTNYQQKYSKSDLTKVEDAEKSNKDKNNKVGTIATVSIFSALLIGGVVLVARRLNKKVKK